MFFTISSTKLFLSRILYSLPFIRIPYVSRILVFQKFQIFSCDFSLFMMLFACIYREFECFSLF